MIQLADLHVRELRISFRESFSHAAATHRASQSLWVEVRTTCGLQGSGEGCPRSYVTGETLSGARDFITRNLKSLFNFVHDMDSLRAWVTRNQKEIDANPAAWCALELAILDVLAQAQGTNVETLLGMADQARTFKYTAVVGTGSHEVFARHVRRYQQLGINDFKLKLSGNIEEDRAKLVYLQTMKCVSRLRLDANNRWLDEEDVVRHLTGMPMPFFALEEPLAPCQYAAMSRIANHFGIQMILDESFQRLSQFAQLDSSPDTWILNVRVSKMGGLLRSLEIIRKAQSSRIPVIVGAHVGETSLLTRAGLVVAQAAGDALLAQEGAFGTYILEHDVCSESLMFQQGGELKSMDAVLARPGFGLAIQEFAR